MGATIGTFVKFKIGEQRFTGEMSSTLNLSRDSIDLADKEAGDWAKFVPGRGSGSVSVDSTADWSDVVNYGAKAAFDAWKAKTSFSWSITEYDDEGAEVIGALKVTGTGYILSLDLDSPDNAKSGYSVSIGIDETPVASINE